jgi:hypothetical protein
MSNIIGGVIYQDNSATIVGRVIALDDGLVAVQADVTSIAYRVVDEAGTEVVASTALTVSTVIKDTLFTDGRWNDLDDTGGNFVATIPTTAFPDGGKVYFVRVTFTMAAAGAVFTEEWPVTTKT